MTTRKLSDGELKNGIARAAQVLDRGIGAIDGGDPLGYGDLLRSLRLLTGRGQGDNLLRRTAKGTGRKLAKTEVTQPPWRIDGVSEPLAFGLGSIPLEDAIRTGDGFQRTPTWVEFDRMMRQQVLIVKGSWADQEATATGSFTWEHLIGVVANKFGTMHLDDQIPEVFDEIFRFKFSNGVHPVAFALRAMGIAVRRIALDLLGPDDSPSLPDRSVMVGETSLWLGELHLYGRLGGMVRVYMLHGSTDPKIELTWKREAQEWVW